jgi:hypothetical protein
MESLGIRRQGRGPEEWPGACEDGLVTLRQFGPSQDPSLPFDLSSSNCETLILKREEQKCIQLHVLFSNLS